MYTPISSLFYDQLMVAIERKIPSTVVYEDANEQKSLKGIVTTLSMHEGKEYLVLDSGQEIALHLVYSFNGKKYRSLM